MFINFWYPALTSLDLTDQSVRVPMPGRDVAQGPVPLVAPRPAA